tara:strand:+ start:593 stop:859 length:267 start_codon:yes stop_codon:yes gene_type:complete
MGQIVIVLIILFFISYFVLNIYEKFQTSTHIKNICYFKDFHKLFYRYKDYEAPVNEYLKQCLNKDTLEIKLSEFMKLKGTKNSIDLPN